MAFFMPSSASLAMSSTMSNLREAGLEGVLDDARADGGPADDALDVATLGHVEHHDGHLVVPAQRERGGVHDFQILVQRVGEGDPLVAPGVGVLARVLVVDAVDL